MNYSVSYRVILPAFFTCLFVFSFIPVVASAQSNECTFTQTLEMGVISAEVQCLQEYLNENGFPLTAVGPGAPGNETDKFGNLTQAAVIEWQQSHDVSPAVGIFGPISQEKYNEVVGATASETATDPLTSATEAERLLSMVDDLQRQIDEKQAEGDDQIAPEPEVAGASTAASDEAERVLKSTMRMILDTEELLEDMDREDDEYEELRDDLGDVLELLFTAMFDYFDGHHADAAEQGAESFEEVIDLFEDAGGESAREEAEDLISDMWDLYEQIEELLDEAEDERADVGNAPELLEDSEELLEDAEGEFAAGVYRQAMSDALDAEELLEDARSDIDIASEDDIERYVEEVIDDYRDARQEVAEAEDDGEEVDEAEDLLRDARRDIQRAELAIDGNDFREAQEHAQDAEDAIEDALDAIGGDSGGDLKEADDVLDDAWDAYRDADDEVDEAEDDNERGADDARDLLNAAKDALDDAEDAYVEEDYDEAIEYAEDAEELIEDALDELS